MCWFYSGCPPSRHAAVPRDPLDHLHSRELGGNLLGSIFCFSSLRFLPSPQVKACSFADAPEESSWFPSLVLMLPIWFLANLFIPSGSPPPLWELEGGLVSSFLSSSFRCKVRFIHSRASPRKCKLLQPKIIELLLVFIIICLVPRDLLFFHLKSALWEMTITTPTLFCL